MTLIVHSQKYSRKDVNLNLKKQLNTWRKMQTPKPVAVAAYGTATTFRWQWLAAVPRSAAMHGVENLVWRHVKTVEDVKKMSMIRDMHTIRTELDRRFVLICLLHFAAWRLTKLYGAEIQDGRESEEVQWPYERERDRDAWYWCWATHEIHESRSKLPKTTVVTIVLQKHFCERFANRASSQRDNGTKHWKAICSPQKR